MNQKLVTAVGRLASLMAVVMFVSYAEQIALNWSGHPGSFWQPATTVMNCAFWSFYGYYKPERDWIIVLPNLLGVAIASITAATAVYCAAGCSL